VGIGARVFAEFDRERPQPPVCQLQLLVRLQGEKGTTFQDNHSKNGFKGLHLKGFNGFHLKYDSGQCQNLALTVLYVPGLLDRVRPQPPVCQLQLRVRLPSEKRTT